MTVTYRVLFFEELDCVYHALWGNHMMVNTFIYDGVQWDLISVLLKR